MISAAALDDIRRTHAIEDLAGTRVRLRRRGGRLVGPCPICSKNPQSRTDARFEIIGLAWVCAACNDGGDVVALVQRLEGLNFPAAVSWLTGSATAPVQPKVAPRLVRTAPDRGHDHRELERCRALFSASQPAQGTLVEQYLAGRGLAGVPLGPLRYHARLVYWIEREDGARQEFFAGPAMLAPILGWPEGQLIGLHSTWVDESRPGAKLCLIHPDTGEQLPAKKVRGRKAGGFIPLSPARGRTRLVVGEGIETVLTMRLALLRQGLGAEIGFWSAVDLGNLAGRAIETVPHPTKCRQAGTRSVPVRVPGPDPDLVSPAVPVPDEITDLVLLKDGDSDPFLTDFAMCRAARRFASPTRSVRVAEPAKGLDFNDMVRRS